MKIDVDDLRTKWMEEATQCFEHILAHITEMEEIWADEPDPEERYVVGQIKVFPYRKADAKSKKNK